MLVEAAASARAPCPSQSQGFVCSWGPQVLLLLGGASQARALNLLRLQLAQTLPRPPTATQQAALQQILAHAFAALKQCFPVVSYSLPGEDLASAGPSSRQHRPLEGSRVQVTLCTQLPALLHLTLWLACQEGLLPAVAAPGISKQGVGAGGSGSGLGSSRSNAAAAGAATTLPSSPPAAGKGGGGRGAAAGGAAARAAGGASVIREGALRYAALLLQRLGQPESLHEALGLTLPREAAAAQGLGQAGAAEGGRLRLGEAALSRVRSAQHTMEVLLECLLTLPGVASAAAAAASADASQRQLCGGDASSQAQAPAPAALPPPQQAQQQRPQGGGGPGQEVEGEVGHWLAALLAHHWELAKLRVACSTGEWQHGA